MKKKPNSHGATLVEVAVGLIIILVFAFGLIDLVRYLYLTNALDAAAHRALSVATWVPDLEKVDDPNAGTSEFDVALEKIVNKALAGTTESLFRENSSAYLSHGAVKYYDINGDSHQFKVDIDSQIGIALPAAGSDGTRNGGFSTQPIGVKINARLRPFTPFVPAISVVGEAWGYREMPVAAIETGPLDCSGRPFNPRNLPTPGDCHCEVIDPRTGQCGCPPPLKEFINASTGEKECRCDVNALSCDDDQLVDAVNCICDTKHCLWAGNTWGPDYGQNRLDNNQCGCEEPQNVIKNPDGTPSCEGAKCVWNDVLGDYECTDSTCTTANCPSNLYWHRYTCSCWCAGGGFNEDNLQNNICECQGIRVMDPTTRLCVCPNMTCPANEVLDTNCSCICQTGRVRDPVSGLCICEPGAVIAENAPTRCCPTCAAKPNSEAFYGVREDGSGSVCGCRCKAGFVEVDGVCQNPRCGQEGGADC